MRVDEEDHEPKRNRFTTAKQTTAENPAKSSMGPVKETSNNMAHLSETCTTTQDLPSTPYDRTATLPTPDTRSKSTIADSFTNSSSSSSVQYKMDNTALSQLMAPSTSEILTPAQKRSISINFTGGTRPRTRPFTSCDNVYKLYMQAQIAGLFENFHPQNPNTIPFLIVKWGNHILGIVKDDEEDFEDFELLLYEFYNDEMENDGGEAICHVEAFLSY